MKAVILVGGEGTRLRPLTLSQPKALLPVVGIPLLERMIHWLKSHGVREVVLTLGYQPSRLKAVFGNGKRLGVKLYYVMEPRALGTGGGVGNAGKFITGTTVVLNGDVLTNIDLSAILVQHKKTKASLTLTLVPVEDPTAYGLVRVNRNGTVDRFLEKPSMDEVGHENLVNAGIYVMEPSILSHIPVGANSSLERDIFPRLAESRANVHAFRVPAANLYWIDVGTSRRYREVHHDILSGRFKADIPGKPIRPGVWVENGVAIMKDVQMEKGILIRRGCKIASRCVLGEWTVLGPGVILGEGTTVHRSILDEGVRVGRGVHLSHAIVGPRVVIGDHAVIEAESLLGEGTRISDYSRS